MDIKDIHLRVLGLCKERRWSYYRLAKESGFEQSALKSITKERNMPSLYTLEKICNAFDITLSDFFDDDIFQHGSIKPKFISVWDELSQADRERVLIYMYGLAHKNIPKEFEDDLR